MRLRELKELKEGMGGSSGGGTPGSGGAGGSSLGIPYPSTYEEEYDKFQYRSPVQRQMSLTTEEQQEIFTDHQTMEKLMVEKQWPDDLQAEALRKYAGDYQSGEKFVAEMTYKGLRRLSNYGLLQNPDNLELITRLPQIVIDKINAQWKMSIPKGNANSVSDLAFQKYIAQPGFLTQPTVAVDADIVMAEGKWIASVIRGEKEKRCHILSPHGVKVKTDQDSEMAPDPEQKELTFVEALDKVWPRDELPQLKDKDFDNTEYTTELINAPLDKIKPSQDERLKKYSNKAVRLLKKGKEKPIVVDKFGYIINGHHRYDAYIKLKHKTIPAIKVNATIEELIDKYM